MLVRHSISWSFLHSITLLTLLIHNSQFIFYPRSFLLSAVRLCVCVSVLCAVCTLFRLGNFSHFIFFLCSLFVSKKKRKFLLRGKFSPDREHATTYGSFFMFFFPCFLRVKTSGIIRHGTQKESRVEVEKKSRWTEEKSTI